MPEITVIKLNTQGHETWRYTGRLLERRAGVVVLEALFNRPDISFHGILLGQGDRFIESYYTDRWYNIFEIHDRHDDHLKGWYCNVTLPASIEESTAPEGACMVSYVDLALDLLVYPDGRQLVLDEDEFADLPVDAATRARARAALVELQRIAAQGELSPFMR